MDISGLASGVAPLEGKMEQQFIVPEGSGALDFLLREVLLYITPSEEDHKSRLRIITRITTLLQGLDHLKGASIKPFGSFVSGLYTRWGDLDISIEMHSDGQRSLELGKNKKRKILSSIKQALIRNGVTRTVQFIPSARVPLLMFEDPNSHISCDISVNNGSGLLKSKLLYWISQIDTRYRHLVYLIKYWAKAHNINDPKIGTLNSFSLSLLVIFHLQTQSPPILPPLKEIYNGDIAGELGGAKNTNEEQIESQFIQNVERFKQEEFGRKNKCTISDLFVSFFAQYASVVASWSKGLMACTFSGKWGNASSIECRIKKQYAMIIVDPFDHTENCARSVTESTLRIISDEFETTAKFLQSFPQLCEMHSLRQSLFGSPHERPRPYIGPFQEKIARTSKKFEESHANKGRTVQVSQTCNPTIHNQQYPWATHPDFLLPAFSQNCSLDERSMPYQPKDVSTVPAIYRHQTQPSFQYNGRQHHQQQQYPPERMQQPVTRTMDFKKQQYPSERKQQPISTSTDSKKQQKSSEKRQQPISTPMDSKQQQYPSGKQQQYLSGNQQPISTSMDFKAPMPHGKVWKPKNDSRSLNC